ncbi:MAG: V-type ATPase subunit [Candidatus Methanofastidiosa archaeon]|nr:V-type ATPase subunit [Candidatus Methanofastidiosa archaeon]
MEDNAAYFNARISAMKAKIFPKLTYEKMMLMELPEITRYISEGDYHQDVTELSKNFKGIDLIEYALNLNLARTYEKLINISSGNINRFITQYMKRWDNENIKSILRGLQSQASSEEIAEAIVPVGKLKFAYLLSLTKMDYESAKRDLEEKKIIPSGIEELKKLEYELDRNYYMDSIALADDIGEEGLTIYLLNEVDIYNLKILLRLKGSGADFSVIQENIIPLGKKITKESLGKFKVMDYEESIRFANKLFDRMDLDPKEPISILEQQIDNYLIRLGERVSHLNMFSTLAALGFILRKNSEISNLRLIVRGKQLGLELGSIEKMLVV